MTKLYKYTYLTELHGCVDRLVPLEGDGHRHEDGPGEGRLVRGVQQVGEQAEVDVAAQAEHLAEALKDGADQIPRNRY